MKFLIIIFCFILLGDITAGPTIYLKSDETGTKIDRSVSSVSGFFSGIKTQPRQVSNSANLINTHFTELLQNELEKRTRCNSNRYANIAVEIDNKYQYDYGIERNNDIVTLKAKNKKNVGWIIEQYIRHLSKNDTCINAVSLPPMILDIENAPYGNFDFAYREPHFNPNLEYKLQPVNGANSVEEYWDLWGHNLYDELKKYGLGKNIFMDGNPHQICFSKQIFYNNVTDYLKKRSGSSDTRLHSRRFLFMPLDNMTACVCSKCRAAGNSQKYATPAVLKFLDRLADRFPEYTFYTAAYHSTAQPPIKRPKHRISGVMISTSELYTGELDQKKKEIDFLETASRWKNYTDTLFVWDYAANFNDYLTPLPVLYVLKKNLKFFRNCGITGVFLQGSSYDYSPFDDVKTHVATALMINGRLDVDMLCRHYFAQFYPVSAEILADYYLSLEKTMEQRKNSYDLHGNLGNAIDSYFITDDFWEFYQKLGYLLENEELSANEKKRLEKMYTAISFTWLQIEFFQQTGSYDIETHPKAISITPEIDTVIKRLSQYSQHNIIKYREKDGNLENYLKFWEKYSNNH